MRKLFFLISICLAAFSSLAQNRTITGKVIDEDGKPLPGVTIRVLSTTLYTITKPDGIFSLTVPTDANQLQFSSVGYANQTVNIQGLNTISVSLVSAAKSLSEVVITGFQQIDKKKFNGAAVTLKASDVKTEGVIDVSRMLEGRAAGVSVQNVSSTFGSAPKVRIRGTTSINGDNKPLWVVDGVVLEDIINISNDQLSSGDPTTLLGSSVAGINANDIETFDILKDAAATAFYGKMFDEINVPDANGNFVLQNTTEAKAGFLKKYALANTNWFDILFKNSLTQEHSLSISSGTDKSQSFFSTSYYQDDGWTIADN